jgi:HK97 gp10 family phage protein
MQVTARMSGGKELNAALKDLGNKVAGRLGSNAVRAGARVIANEAKARAPVLTGALRKSIRVFTAPRRESGTVRTAFVGSDVYYSRFVEFGSAHQPAQSFLRAAADVAAQAAVDKIAENLSSGIEREVQRYQG